MNAEPLFQAEISLEIPFHDLDPAGYVWHGHYAKYLELARCELLKQWEYRLRIEYLIRSAATGERLTKASTVQVAVSAASGEMCLRSPDILFERLGVPA